MTEKFEKQLNLFFEGLKETLDDMFALEVNTMIVNQITGFKFNSFSAYEAIYFIPNTDENFQEKLKLSDYNKIYDEYQRIPQSATETEKEELWGPLKKQIEELKEHIKKLPQTSKEGLQPYIKNIFIDRIDCLESPENINQNLRQYVQLRKKLAITYYSIVQDSSHEEDYLPPPEEARSDILENGTFLRELRTLRELYFLISGRDGANKVNIYDLIYAQTVIQLDGDMLNRFDKKLLEDENKDFLLETHQKAIEEGQKNWRELISAVIDTMNKVGSIISSMIK